MATQRWAVVGGGLVGSAIGLRLQLAGFEVVLVDRGDPRRGASFGNIGHIAGEQGEPMPSPAMLKSVFGRLFVFGGPLNFRLRDVGLWMPWAFALSGGIQVSSDAARGSNPERASR